ncbi:MULTISPECIES: small hydrophilic protein [Streptomyces]|uniref:small hydrophilic protein n=1 Tax=Streptomyces TaxID=1883 RepID=UPI0019140917|nr:MULTISPECIES: small hydrophilic protein [Streptomyces]MBK5991047.1 small hydrophilic protein [Streptomyces sp. MBT58]MEE1733664.1 small hydrophilic protein [Streptomyces sp. BE282]QQZ56605.1 small hydrophilic protein [Streptomyces microflavus]WSR94074.1 small hydrophilic protein [Streptomyces microflavus]
MAFSPRLAALAAVVAVPLGIAATSYAMTDTPEAPKVPPAVQLDERPGGTPPPGPSASPSAPASPSSPSSPSSTGGDVVPGPSAADGDDDDDDDLGDDG